VKGKNINQLLDVIVEDVCVAIPRYVWTEDDRNGIVMVEWIYEIKTGRHEQFVKILLI
jgi:hypothetical protein